MVEGYIDSQLINMACIKDNWDLSVLWFIFVVCVLQINYGIDFNCLIVVGWGEFNVLVINDIVEGWAMNCCICIIILLKFDQFYDLLNLNQVLE